MAHVVSPLNGARFDGLISVREMAPQGMITLRGDLAAPAIKNAATGVGGHDMPGQRQASGDADRAILWMSPDELLLLLPYAEVPGAVASIGKLLEGSHALVADVSDARTGFELRGEGLREVLAKLAPADLSPGALPVGEVRRTRLGQVPAAFWLKSEASAQVICFRSVARYVFDQFRRAAQPGSTVGFF
ncbi:MAG: sarcosine oxidase subunit gamma [Rhodobacteraceae bacterium]|nr:MAG: sarcosine oxidase subunit gamma [Paracoccaceae bacterium]